MCVVSTTSPAERGERAVADARLDDHGRAQFAAHAEQLVRKEIVGVGIVDAGGLFTDLGEDLGCLVGRHDEVGDVVGAFERRDEVGGPYAGKIGAGDLRVRRRRADKRQGEAG
jgi:hypothetical protein